MTNTAARRAARRTAAGTTALLTAAAAFGAAVLAGPAAAATAPGPATAAAPTAAPGPKPPAGLGAARQADPAEAAAETAATAKARGTGKPVPVPSLTDPASDVVANPDGTLTLTQHATPVRVRRGTGFVPVDTTLTRRADGTVAPGAVDTDVAFSAGGSGPLATLTKGGAKLSVSWPGRLPAPVLSGDSATYPEVLPGVDLVMTARVDGYGEVLVVKTPAAAANPALATLHFGITVAGAKLTAADDGTETAVDAAGHVLFRSDTPIMWDSTDTTALPATPAAATAAPPAGIHRPAAAARSAQTAQSSAPSAKVAVPAPAGTDPSDARHPGAAAHVARLGMKVTGSDLAVTPDPALLTGPDRVFPLFIDPSMTGTPSIQAWADINSAGGKWTSGTDAPIGVDNWSGCGSWCGAVNRAYFEMNDSFFQGANVTDATLWIWFKWAADSAAQPTEVWLDPDFPSNLNWSNKPVGSSPSTYVNKVTSCAGHGTSGCAAGLVPVSVTSAAQTAAGGGRRDLEVDASDETNTYQWKRIDPTQTYWSVTFYRAPRLTSYSTTPNVTGPGGTFVNSNTVTMQASGSDDDGENIASHYEIWNWSNGSATSSVATGLSTSQYTWSGGPAVSYTLPGDGTYAWRATAVSEQGQMWSGWGPWQVFTVDTSVPPAPTVESPQFPQNEMGGSYSDTGKFTLSTQSQDNVAGYLFSLDGDLGSLVWSASGQPATYGGGAVSRAAQYWVAGDSGSNTVLSFSPLTVGIHRLYVKAVDQAGLTGPQTIYQFYAGLTTPRYVYGDQLANGCAVNTCNGNTVAVPAGVATFSAGGSLGLQYDCCDVHFGDGKQAMMSNGSGKVAVGDSVVYSFYLPSAGLWDFGADLTSANDYGQYKLVLDQGSATQAVLTSMYDAYTPTVQVGYRDFGIAANSAGTPVKLAAGLHTVTLTVTGKNASSYGYQTGVDTFRMAPQSATCAITDLSACANNVAISADGHPEADADGWGSAFSASQLAAAGWTPGASFTLDGAPMTLPNYGGGKADNILASGQTVTVPSQYPNNGNALEFLAFGTEGQVDGAVGSITYAKPCNSTPTQTFTIDSVPDWADQSAVAKRIVAFTSMNYLTGTRAVVPQMYVVSIPLTCPGYPVASVSLPVVTDKSLQTTTALHIVAMGIRASSYTDASDRQNWTGTFAAAVDSHLGGLDAQTVRLPVHISVAGSQLRLRLSNARGTVPVSFDHVTVAAQSAAGGPVPAATPVNVLFKAGTAVTIPAGGEAVSDALSFATTGQETLLVSAHLSAADSDVVGHGAAQTTGWTAAAGTDQAADTTGTPFSTTISTVPWLAGVDVTSAGATVGSLVLFGDQTVNSDSASGDGRHHLSDVLAGKLAAANGGTVPYGVLSAGTNSWSQSNNLLPALSASAANTVPTSATDPANNRILEGANVRTVLISTGMSDILAGGDATSIENKLSALSEQVRHFYTDDAMDADVTLNNGAALVTVYIATIPPNATALTAGQEAVRVAVNSWILSSRGGSYANGHADGAIDFAAAVSSTGTDAGTTVATADLYNGSPNDSYYAALAQRFLTDSSPTGSVGVQPMLVR